MWKAVPALPAVDGEAAAAMPTTSRTRTTFRRGFRSEPRAVPPGAARRDKPNAIQTPWPPVAKYNLAESAGAQHGTAIRPTGRARDAANPNGRNPGDVWTISTRPYRGAHFAPFPIDIPLRAIAAGCRPGGTVLDPFSGAATTALAARQLGRQFIGIELNADYCKLAVARIREASAAAGGIE